MKVSNFFKALMLLLCVGFFAQNAQAQVAQGEGFFILDGAKMSSADLKSFLKGLREVDPGLYLVDVVQGGEVSTYGSMSLKDLDLIAAQVNADPSRYSAGETTVVHETVWQHKDNSIARYSAGETTVVHKTVWQHKDAVMNRSTKSEIETLLAKY